MSVSLFQDSDFQLCGNITIEMQDIPSALDKKIKEYAEQIDAIWMQETKKRGEKLLFNGSILCLSSIEYKNDAIILKAYVTEYKYYLAYRFGVPLDITLMGVNGVTFAGQGDDVSIVMARRSTNVTQYPNCYEFSPCGSLDKNAQDYRKHLLIELQEELGLMADDVISVTPFAILKNPVEGNILICMSLHVQSLKSIKINAMEYSAIEYLSIDEVDQFLLQNKIVDGSLSLWQAWKDTRP